MTSFPSMTAGESGAHAEGRGAQNRPRVDNTAVGVEAETFAFAISPAIIELPGSLSADGLNQRPFAPAFCGYSDFEFENSFQNRNTRLRYGPGPGLGRNQN